MSIESILNKLDGVVNRGNGQYFARCPSHDDRSPSLSVKIQDDGTTLIHCFAGCSTYEVVSSVGMQLSDLFPQTNTFRTGKQLRWNPRDLLKILYIEITVVYLAASALDDGKKLLEDDFLRLSKSVTRINQIIEVSRVLE